MHDAARARVPRACLSETPQVSGGVGECTQPDTIRTQTRWSQARRFAYHVAVWPLAAERSRCVCLPRRPCYQALPPPPPLEPPPSEPPE
jgi:hypothetical protein